MDETDKVMENEKYQPYGTVRCNHVYFLYFAYLQRLVPVPQDITTVWPFSSLLHGIHRWKMKWMKFFSARISLFWKLTWTLRSGQLCYSGNL
jgi:hypothetical protein